MKSVSKHLFAIIGLASLVVFGCAASAQAQNREKYVISAKAGGVNLVSGNVTVRRAGGVVREQALTSSDDLLSGDVVTTGAGGRVEVLLSPGAYMRVDERSEFEMSNASLDHLLVKLVKGGAVVEVTGADGVELMIGINTPQVNASIVRGGIYRFKIMADETTEIAVRKGRLFYGKALENRLKGGQRVLIGHSGPTEVAKLDKKNQDALDIWSKERAKTLAHANSLLQTRSLTSAVEEYFDISWNGWGLPGRYFGLGLWIYSSRAGGYCFLPFNGRYWSSPYGYGYPTIWWFGDGRNPWGTNTAWGNGYPPPPVSGTSGSTVGAGGSTSGGTGGSTGGSAAPPPAPVPQPTRPVSDTPVERGPRREYSTQSPNE